MQNEMVFGGDENVDIPWEIFVERGYLTQAMPATTVCCACMQFVEVVWLTDRSRRKSAYAYCNDCGPVPISHNSLLRWELCLEALLHATAEAMHIRGRVEEIIPDLLWRLGRKRNTEYLYLRRFSVAEKREVLSVLARKPKCVLLVPTENVARRLRQELDFPQVLALEAFASINECGDFDANTIVLGDLTDSDTARIPTKKTAASPKRAARAANIEKLALALESHLKSAREHAIATTDRGNMEILPRPTQAQLAKMAGLTSMDVSRCLRDPEAKLLRMLWEKADDIRSLLRY